VTNRPTFGIWWICGLLLLASATNYMDRQTLSTTSVQITRDFQINEEQYGTLETAFGLAFACGSMIFGWLSDRVSVRWLYPLVLLLWSAMGFATGLAETYAGLLGCRLLLGLFEAGHWPCALITTQRLLPADWRALGNSLLQSGTAIGAMVTPLIIRVMVDDDVPGSWRLAFQVVAAAGACWVVLWFVTIRPGDLEKSARLPSADGGQASEKEIPASAGSTIGSILLSRRFLVLILVVVAINLSWQQFRVWMMKFLVQGRGYSRDAALDVTFWFNIVTDIGCISAGIATAALCRRGWTGHGSRILVFGLCSFLVASGCLIPWIPAGPTLIGVLLAVGLGALGLFPCYYTLTQELSSRHLGKLVGALAIAGWIVPSIWHREFGAWVDRTQSYDCGMSLTSLAPLVAWAAITWLWPRSTPDSDPQQDRSVG
jgi:MFS transporter, ACS family, hexuronate transporter